MLSRLISLVPLSASVVEASSIWDPILLHDIVIEKGSTPPGYNPNTAPERPPRNPNTVFRQIAPDRPARNPDARLVPVNLLSVPVWEDVDKSWLRMDSLVDIIRDQNLTWEDVSRVLPCTFAFTMKSERPVKLFDVLFYQQPTGVKEFQDEAQEHVCAPYLTLRNNDSRSRLLETVINRMINHWNPNRTRLFRSILVEAIVGSDLPMPYFVPGIVEKLDQMGLSDLPLNEGTIQGLFMNMVSVKARMYAIKVMLQTLSKSKVLSDENFELLKIRVREKLQDLNYAEIFKQLPESLSLDQQEKMFGLLSEAVWAPERMKDIEPRMARLAELIKHHSPTYKFSYVNSRIPCTVYYWIKVGSPALESVYPPGPKQVSNAQRKVCKSFLRYSSASGYALLEDVIDRMWTNKSSFNSGLFKSILVEATVGSDSPMPYFVPGIVDKLELMGLTDLPLNEGTLGGMFDHMISVDTRMEALHRMVIKLSTSKVLSEGNLEKLKARIMTELETRELVDQYNLVNSPGYDFLGHLHVWNGKDFELKIRVIGERIRFIPDFTFQIANQQSPCAIAYIIANQGQKGTADVFAILRDSWKVTSLNYIQLNVCRVLSDNFQEPDKAETSLKVINEMIVMYQQRPAPMNRIDETIQAAEYLLFGQEGLSNREKHTLFTNIIKEMIRDNFPIPYWKSGVVAALTAWDATGLVANPATLEYLKRALANHESISTAQTAMRKGSVFEARSRAELDEIFTAGSRREAAQPPSYKRFEVLPEWEAKIRDMVVPSSHEEIRELIDSKPCTAVYMIHNGFVLNVPLDHFLVSACESVSGIDRDEVAAQITKLATRMKTDPERRYLIQSIIDEAIENGLPVIIPEDTESIIDDDLEQVPEDSVEASESLVD